MCVQLKSRHWIIRHADGEILQEVKGEGVIGEFPVLTPGMGHGANVHARSELLTALSGSC